MVARTMAFVVRGLLGRWKQCTGNTDNIGNNVPVLRPPETTKYLINKRVLAQLRPHFPQIFLLLRQNLVYLR